MKKTVQWNIILRKITDPRIYIIVFPKEMLLAMSKMPKSPAWTRCFASCLTTQCQISSMTIQEFITKCYRVTGESIQNPPIRPGQRLPSRCVLMVHGSNPFRASSNPETFHSFLWFLEPTDDIIWPWATPEPTPFQSLFFMVYFIFAVIIILYSVKREVWLMNDEFERLWNETVLVYSYTSEKGRKATTSNFSQDS